MVDEGTGELLHDRIRSGELHVAVDFQDAILPRREHAGLERRDLLHEPFLVALPPNHRLAHHGAVHLSDLADEDWTATYTDGLIVRACRAAGFEPRLVSLTHDQLAIRALIIRGLAVTLVPGLLGETFSDTALCPIAGDGPQRDVYALLPPGGRHSLAHPMLTALTESANEMQALLPV
jgi:DNA-binding transcriptional LysR family regulator